MNKPCNDNIRKLTQYDSLSIDTLRELFRLDFDAFLHQNIDVHTLMYIA